MKRALLPMLMLVFTGIANAQEISIDDLVAIRKMDFPRIDSFLQTKDYHRQVLDANDISMHVYIWTGETSFGRPAMRSVHVGRPPGRQMLDVEYGMWQKDDAQRFIDRLIRAGFEKRTVTIPGMGGGAASTQIAYRKNKIDVSYQEQPQDGVTLYIFNIGESY